MFKHLKNDIPASIVVFFVALPLCLGIALASDAPPLSGLIAGIIGGIVVGYISKSKIGVSGPAAGLAAIVAAAIGTLGSFETFLVAVVLAGVIQIIFGIIKMGVIGYFFPNSVINGMLSGIGIIIILKQIPHLFGYDSEPEGADSFIEKTGENTFSAILHITENITLGSMIIGFLGLAIILFWDNLLAKKHPFFKLLQGSLVAVFVGTILQVVFSNYQELVIAGEHLVQVPVAEKISDYAGFLTFPDFSQILNPDVIVIAFTLALVASLETLLSVEATDKLDPDKNVTPTNRELFAQGFGNIFSGLIGGLPITQVIVRSSANVQSNAKSKFSTILHGFLLLISVLSIPMILNHIPKAVLASVLILVGYKLAKPALFKKYFNLGWTQYLPFIVTILVIVFKDLLWGIFTGLTIGIFVVLYKSFQNSMFLHKQDIENKHEIVKIRLAEEVTFLNKAKIRKELSELKENSKLELDVTKTKYLDHDVKEILEDFVIQAKNKNIHVHLISERGNVENPSSFIEFFKLKKIINN
jgi:MFS superfamily sulfate permease-like transporter